MKIAIYSRKSRATDQGESIQNQIDMCKNYAKTHFPDAEIKFFIYTDDGFSGGNIDRPQFQLLLRELKKGTYDVLMCYRLDRISRNVSDFSATLDLLTKKDVVFVSIKENFDTSTPMGRAMIHIASVFAQLERETIAERIKDNIYELAKTGRWLGGRAPTGFTGKREKYISVNGSEKFAVNLIPVPEEQELVKLVFDKYIEFDSIAKVDTYCMQNDIKSKNGKQMQPGTIGAILGNPVYCIADQTAYEYFTTNKSSVEDNQKDFDGAYGIMPFGRTDQSNNSTKRKDISEWIIAIGKHQGIIESRKWIKVQDMLKKNSHKAIRGERPSSALLTPLLRCADCGARMLISSNSILADGTLAYYYRCETKSISKGTKCQMKNVSGHKLDRHIIENLKEMIIDKTKFIKLIENERKEILAKKNIFEIDKDKIKKEITKNDEMIAKLIIKLVEFDDPNMNNYIQKQVDVLHEKNEQLKEQLFKAKEKDAATETSNLNLDLVMESLHNFREQIDTQDVLGKRRLIRNIIQRIDWDGEKTRIYMYTDKLDGDQREQNTNFYHHSRRN